MGAALAVLGWVKVAVSAYSLYQYLFSNDKQTSVDYKYSEGALRTKVDAGASIPIIYGEVKSAGNLIYTVESADSKYLYKMISFGEGQVYSISNVKFNDVPYSTFKNTGVRIYLGTSHQQIDDIVPGSQIEKARVVGGMKNEAYIATWAKASEDINGDYAVTAIVKGKLIKVFSRTYLPGYTYDEDLQVYYTVTYSNNPAWCILDFLTSYSGCGIPYDEIDIDSFIDSAQYCDEPPLTGGQQHRFTLNIRIDNKKPKLEWVKTMMSACRAYPTYQNGKFGMHIERKAEVSQVFKPQHINELNVWWSPASDIADVARIGYVEPANEWVQIYASAESDTPFRTPPYIREIDILGVTNFNQASRLAWFYLNQSTTCTMYISFKTDRRALNRSVGEVIEVQDEYITSLTELNRSGKRFRIYQIAEDSDGRIEIFAREYNEYLYYDLLGSAPVTVNTPSLPSPYTSPPPVLGFSNIDQVYYVQKDKTAVSYITATAIIPAYSYYYQLRYFYSENSGDYIEVGTSVSGQLTVNNAKIGSTYKLMVYLENNYGLRSIPYYSEDILITGKNAPPSPVTDLTAVETTGGILLTWKAATDPDLDGYNIYQGQSADSTYLISERYGGTSYTYITDETGSFTFHVRSIDTSGNMSEAVTASTTIIPPEAVQDFDVYQNGQDLTFRWTQNSNERVKVGYEIRRGESWDLGELIGRVNGNTLKMSYYSTAYEHKFWIKAISMNGVYSTNASYATIDIAPTVNMNVIYKESPTDTKPGGAWGDGSRINLNIVDGGLVLSDGVKKGEQIYKINLPEVYSSRNWIDAKITAIKTNFLTWEEATFSWDSDSANSMWLSEGQTINSYISHQISRKTTVPDNVIEYIPCNNDVDPAISSTIEESYGIEYTDGRFFNGVYVKDTTLLSWNVNVPRVFSYHFQVRVANGLPYHVIFASLSGDDGKLVIGYKPDTKEFYLVDCYGNYQFVTVNFSTEDYITFAISQGETLRRFYVASYSSGVDKLAYSEQPYAPIGVFTKYSLYGTI